jgi:hypothetical protein
MQYWIKDFPVWDASYTNWGAPDLHFKDWYAFNHYIAGLESQEPWPIIGAAGYDMWQVTGSAYLPDLNGPWDIDVVKMTKEQFLAKIHGTIPPVQPPVQPPVKEVYMVIVSYLTVRAGPGTQFSAVAWLPQHEIKTIIQKQGVWGMYAPGYWINISSNYCQKIL